MDIGTPFSLPDIIFGLAFALLLFYIVLGLSRRAADPHVVITAFAVKTLACVAYGVYLVYVSPGGDSLYYQRAGVDYAAEVRQSFASGDLTYLLTHSFLSIKQDATTNFVNLSGLVHVFLFDSFLASSLFLAMLGLLGQFLIYKTFVSYYPDPRIRLWWQIGVLYFPTLTFWSAGLLKDVLGILGLGCVLWGMRNLLMRPRLPYLLLTASGIYILLLFRPPVAAVLFIAAIAWMLFSTPTAEPGDEGGYERRRLKLQALVVFAGILGVALLGTVAPRYSIPQLPQTIANDNAIAQGTQGTQTGVAVRATALVHSASWGALIRSWPSAMVVALYRPFPWEAASVATLGAAFENIVLLLLSVRALFYFLTKPELRTSVIRSPLFSSCVIFLALFAFGVGAANPNLGTISRYRIPMIPFLVGVFVILEYHLLRIRLEEPHPQRVVEESVGAGLAGRQRRSVTRRDRIV